MCTNKYQEVYWKFNSVLKVLTSVLKCTKKLQICTKSFIMFTKMFQFQNGSNIIPNNDKVTCKNRGNVYQRQKCTKCVSKCRNSRLCAIVHWRISKYTISNFINSIKQFTKCAEKWTDDYNFFTKRTKMFTESSKVYVMHQKCTKRSV